MIVSKKLRGKNQKQRCNIEVLLELNKIKKVINYFIDNIYDI